MAESPKPALWRRLLKHGQALVGKLVSLKDRPHAIAGGVAIGMLIGFTPLFGLKTLLCIGLAFLLRCNPIAAVIAVSLHDVVTPFWPFLLVLEYRLGAWVLGAPHLTPGHHFRMQDVMKWTTFLDVGFPMLVGSLFLAIPAAIIAYFLTIGFLKRRAQKTAKSVEP